MAETAIEWATEVWNPFTGCDRVSPGCAHCYAATQAASLQRKERGRIAKARAEGKPDPKVRYQNDGDPKTSGPGFSFTVHWDKLLHPPRFKPGARVFVNSMSDVFHEEAPPRALSLMWQVFFERQDVDFLVLTKRPERMRTVLTDWERHEDAAPGMFPLPNVWLGTSIENRKFVGRADILRDTPAAIRFISAEPLLGPLIPRPTEIEGIGPCEMCEKIIAEGGGCKCGHCGTPWPYPLVSLDLTGIDWLIVGGESGPDHRPFDLDWARGLRTACAETETAFFFKQVGGVRPTSGGRLLDGRTWDQFPTPRELAK